MSTAQPLSSTSLVRSNDGEDIISNLANFLPTGSFLAFQSVAPLFTNNGDCGKPEKVVTSMLIGIFGIGLIVVSFTDSFLASSGKLYYGIVTRKGLYSSQFAVSHIDGVEGSFYTAKSKYKANVFDYIHSFVTVGVFCALALLTPPVQMCFFPNIPRTILKSVPVLVSLVAAGYFSIAPAPRHGLGYSAQSKPEDIVQDYQDFETSIITTVNNTNTSNVAAAVQDQSHDQTSSELEAGGHAGGESSGN